MSSFIQNSGKRVQVEKLFSRALFSSIKAFKWVAGVKHQHCFRCHAQLKCCGLFCVVWAGRLVIVPATYLDTFVCCHTELNFNLTSY